MVYLGMDNIFWNLEIGKKKLFMLYLNTKIILLIPDFV